MLLELTTSNPGGSPAHQATAYSYHDCGRASSAIYHSISSLYVIYLAHGRQTRYTYANTGIDFFETPNVIANPLNDSYPGNITYCDKSLQDSKSHYLPSACPWLTLCFFFVP